MNFILGRGFLMVVGISTYLETEYNYSKILCMKLGEKKYCNIFHIQTSHVLMQKYFY